MTGYTRADINNNIANGNIASANDIDAEFDAVVSAFHKDTGHSHNGADAEGAPIEVVGPAQDYLAGALAFRPKTHDTYDLGTTGYKFKDLHLSGVVHSSAVGAVYASRAEAVAATVPTPVQVITVMHFGRALRYVAGTSTALATNGGSRQWAPADLWTFMHWGADPTGASDSQNAVFNAITAATIQVDNATTINSDTLMQRRPLSGLGGTFALHSTVSITRRAGVTIMDATFVQGGAAFPTGSTFASPLFNVTGNTSGRSRNIYFERCNFMCGQGAEGIRWNEVRRCGMSDCLLYGFRDYGVRTENGSTDSVFTRVVANQWWFAEVENQPFTMRTAKCFDMNTADYTLDSCVASFGAIPFYQGASGPAQVIGCHFYNGASPDPNPAEAYCAFVARDARNILFSGCYFDNASVGVEDGHARFIGCHFQQTGNRAGGRKLRLIATTAGQTFAGFVLVGNSFNGTNTGDFDLITDGGTIADAADRRYVIGFNNKTNGGPFVGDLPEYWLRTGVPTIT